MIKRVTASIAAILTALLLASCAAVPPENSPPVVTGTSTVETEPSAPSETPDITPPDGIKWELADLWGKIDGSTATIPLTSALYDFLNGGGWPPVHNTTSAAYNHLFYGLADLVFVTYPSEAEFNEAESRGLELEITPVTKDALVFLVNIDNPINGITLSQLRDIYSGKITNWKQLGGLDEEIIPYQRTENSGSQTLFMKLLMGDTAPMNPPTEWIAETMGSLVESVSGYNNARNAIGYSMFYYVNNMYGNSQFKLLSIDGVKPSRETITRGEYALEDFYYAVLLKDTPADSPVRKLVDWVLSDDGQAIAVKAGYIPLRPIENSISDETVDPIYLGDVDNSGGTGGTVLKTGEGEPGIDVNGVPPPLSDMFFNGFNYIRYINSEIMAQLNRVDNEFFQYTWGEQYMIRPFTGIPNDYPNYELPQYGYILIYFPENNPFFKQAANFHIPLSSDISPYGTEANAYSVTYDYAGKLLPNAELFTLNVSIPKSPAVAERINEQLRVWESGFADNREAVELINEFVGWFSGMMYDPVSYVYRLQPQTSLWKNLLSVSYVLATYDGPSIHMPMVYTICFDINTGETANLADKLPDTIDYSKAMIFAPLQFKDGAMTGGEYMQEGYIPAKGSVITEAWSAWCFYIREPDGRVLQVSFWGEWE